MPAIEPKLATTAVWPAAGVLDRRLADPSC
jgi:hypothetical protein